MSANDKRRKVPPPQLVEKAREAVTKLQIATFLDEHWSALFGKLEEADENAQTAPIDADMMFIVLSLPIASSVIHLASSRPALAEARRWVADEWGKDADPVPILSALTLARIAVEGLAKNSNSEVWQRIMARVAELTDDLTESAEDTQEAPLPPGV